MAFKNLLIMGLVLTTSLLTAGANEILNEHFLGNRDNVIRWEYKDDGYETEDYVKVTRYAGGITQWYQTFQDITYLLDAHEIPHSAYMVTDDVVTFPVTIEDSETKKLRRKQVALDLETGDLLWEKEVYTGISQRYFYSYSDGKYLLIHNQHEYKGSQLLCLDINSGKVLWEKEGLPQPALALSNQDSFILHSGLLQEFVVIEKKSGNTRHYLCSSAVVLWNEKPVFLRKQDRDYRVIALNEEGDEEVLFTIENEPNREVYQYLIQPYGNFMSRMVKGIVPVALFGDKLILQRQADENRYALSAYSLPDQGRREWDIVLPPGESFQIDGDYKTSYILPYGIDNTLIRTYPRNSSFYRIEQGILPILIKRDSDFDTSYALIDLNKGELIYRQNPVPPDSLYVIKSLIKGKDSSYLFLQSILEDDDSRDLVLKINSESGQFSGVHPYEREESPWHVPSYSIIDGCPEIIEWEEISEDSKHQFLDDPGFTEEIFEANPSR